MKHILGIFLFLCSLSVYAADYESTGDGIRFNSQSMDYTIQFYSPTIVRVYKVPQSSPYQSKSLVVIKKPQKMTVDCKEIKDGVEMSSTALRVVVNTRTGGIRFLSPSGEQLLLDKDYGTSFTPKDDAGKPSNTVRQSFLLDPDEPIYGVGQILDNKFNRRNSNYHIQNENMSTFSPYFMSVKGYGVYFDNYSISDFVDNAQELSYQSLGHCADYYFMYGGNADGVIAQVRDLTGHAPMLPLWTYGFLQSKERYKTQDESLDVLKKYRELQIPIDAVIQDWRYWPEHKNDSVWNSHSFDAKRFPNPVKWVDEIHRLHAKLLIVAWPGFAPLSPLYDTLNTKGMLYDFYTWPPKSGARPYDVFNPEAREIYWKSLNKGLFSYIHNDGWWLDSTEPDHIDRKETDYDQATYLGSYRSMKNAYSLMHNTGIATQQKEFSKDKRVVILTRSGFIGQQRLGSNTWSGDVTSTWEMLQKQIPAALNFTMMGIPNWNSDIGGFFARRWNSGGGAKNPKYQDLYIRWMQFGAFCPMMRSHGTELPREIWNFGERGDWCFDAQEKIINVRYSLLPYIYGTSWDVSANDGTFMRALVMDFPKDKRVYNLGSEYMFGRSLLVSPVTEPDVKTWNVYLPEGADWYDFWTNEKKNGGQNVCRDVPKDILPVYVKSGSILPIGPKVQYSNEKRWDKLELRVYPGADVTFTLYEDEFDNYNYEKGMFTTILMTWDDANGTLKIGQRKGQYKGMIKNRKFTVVLPNGKSKVVGYNGKEITVKL